MTKKTKVSSESLGLIKQIDNINQIAFKTLISGSSQEVENEIADTMFNDYDEFFHEEIKLFSNMYKNLTKSQIDGTDNSDLFTNDIEKFSKSSTKGYLCNPLNNILIKLISVENQNLNANQKSAQMFLKRVVQLTLEHNKNLSFGSRAIFKLNSGKKNKGVILNIPNYLFSIYSGSAKFEIEKLKLIELNKDNYEENKINKSISDTGLKNVITYFTPKIPTKDMELLFNEIDQSLLNSDQIDCLNDPYSTKSEKSCVLEDVFQDDINFREEWKTLAKSLLNSDEINFARDNILKDLEIESRIVDLKFKDFEIELLIADLDSEQLLSDDSKRLIEDLLDERNLVAKSIYKPSIKLSDILNKELSNESLIKVDEEINSDTNEKIEPDL